MPDITDQQTLDVLAAAEARIATLETALANLHAEVEMAEAVGICLPDRTASLVAGQLLGRRPTSITAMIEGRD